MLKDKLYNIFTLTFLNFNYLFIFYINNNNKKRIQDNFILNRFILFLFRDFINIETRY